MTLSNINALSADEFAGAIGGGRKPQKKVTKVTTETQVPKAKELGGGYFAGGFVVTLENEIHQTHRSTKGSESGQSGLCSCGCLTYWRSPRGDVFCCHCSPPVRRSPAFIRELLVWDDWEQTIAPIPNSAGGRLGDPHRRSAASAHADSGGPGSLAPPAGVSLDEWWESLIEPDDYFRDVAACRELAGRSA